MNGDVDLQQSYNRDALGKKCIVSHSLTRKLHLASTDYTKAQDINVKNRQSQLSQFLMKKEIRLPNGGMNKKKVSIRRL